IAGLPGQVGQFIGSGVFAPIEPYDSSTKGINGDITKTFHFAGTQSINVGGTVQFPHYYDHQYWPGPRYTPPTNNASTATCTPGLATNPCDPGYDTATVNGVPLTSLTTDSQFALTLANNVPFLPTGTCTLCPYMEVPGYSTPQQVVLQQVRGRLDGGVTNSKGTYAAAYINDAWQMSKYVTLNVGVRWEQQRLTGVNVTHAFVNMWSPRVGFIVDPQGNRKQKIYANFGRYAYVLPLDAAVRSLSNESDFASSYWAPQNIPNTPGSGRPAGTPAGATCVVLNSLGTTQFVPSSANLLNLATDPAGNNIGIPTGAGCLCSSGEPFAPGTRMEFTDEFLVGYDREFKGGIVASVRYIDRRLKRVIEDQGGISVEQFNALAANGGGLNYFIGNPNAKQDIFVNPNELTFSLGTSFVAPLDGSGNPLPLDAANEAAYVKAGVPSGCFDANGNPTPYFAFNQFSGYAAVTGGNPAGSACFPSVNTNSWINASGNLLPDCTNFKQSQTPGACAAFGGEFYPDGKADTYKDPKREYEAVEFEVRKAF